jgi:rubrerythrin
MADTQKSIKGTKTEQNLANAYVSESTAYTRYTYFSQSAQKEGYYQYAKIFAETADNELHHAKIFLKYLTDGAVTTVPIGVDPGILTPTVDNLKVAAAEEEKEGVEQYIKSAEVAEEEGFQEIADRFRAIASIENHHKERFDLLRSRIENGTVWKRDKPIKWQCQVCGYIFEGVEPPEKCPACYHPRAYFMPEEDNY